MTRSRLAGVAALVAAAALPSAARPQTWNLEGRATGAPVGIAVPFNTVAGAEEPTALEINPAGAGFTGDFTLQYFHEGTGGYAGDGFWVATPLGPLVPAFSMQWIRPGSEGGARFRKTTLGLALAGGQTASFAVAWNWYASPTSDLDALSSFDLGLTLRPWRHLSVGLSTLGLTGRLGGERTPVRYNLGVATRLWRDRVTLSGDLLSDDQGRGDLMAKAVALGAGLELPGAALLFQLQLPAHANLPGAAGATYVQVALAWNGPHLGVVGGGGSSGGDGNWILGARVSAQRYRSVGAPGHAAPALDLADALSRPRSLLFGGERDPYGALLRRLADARDDPTVPAIVVKIDDLPVGQGRVEELRRLVTEAKAKKPVVAYLVGGGWKEYYLASAATHVLAPPSADLFPAGLATTSPFLRDLLAKLGVTFDVVAIGRYKSAPDALVRQDMSEPQREVTDSVLDDVFGRQVQAVAAARRLEASRVRELVDRGVFTGEQARDAGLVDATAWPDELDGELSRRAGRELHLSKGWERAEPRSAQRWGPRRYVGVIRVDGPITRGKSRRDPFGAASVAGSETLAQLLRDAAQAPSIAAVVVRVDSPGGDSFASDLVWREIVQLRRAGKPVVVSMGDLAASGGYLVAVAGDRIVAEPSTLTGSIGVFAVKPDLSGLLHDIGVHAVTLKRGEHADLETVTRRWTDAERALIEKQVRAFYDLFVSRVAEGRNMTREAVEQVAGGRVWTGAQALQRGLVDEIGSLDDAIRVARERAGQPGDEELEVKVLEPPRGLWSSVAEGLTAGSPSLLSELASRSQELRALALLLDVGPIVALPLAWLTAEDGAALSRPR